MNKRDIYLEKQKAQLEQHSAKIALMRANASEVGANLKLEYMEQVDALEAKLAGLQDRYRDLKDTDEKTWERIQDGAESAWNDFTDLLDRALKRVKEV